MSTRPTVVLGVIGSDIHVVGHRVLELALETCGFNVVALGAMVSQGEFIEAAIETGAHAILVSSLYGHGELDCEGFRDRCDEAGLRSILLYVGGNLSVTGESESVIEARFFGMGFDRVGHPHTGPAEIIDWLREDLAGTSQKSVGKDR